MQAVANKYKRFSIASISLSVIMLSLFFLACNGKKDYPLVKDGIIEIHENDINNHAAIPLNGEWKVKWQDDNRQFIYSDYDASDWESIKVPGYLNEQEKPSTGYGWLRLKIINHTGKTLAFYLDYCSAAYKFYVNEKLIMENGSSGTDSTKDELAFPPNIPRSVLLPKVRVLNVVWEISDFFVFFEGPKPAPLIGTERNIDYIIWVNNLRDYVIIGLILMMALYNFCIWLGRKEDKSSLYFSICCLVTLVRLIAINNILEQMFFDINLFELRKKLEFISIALGWLFFISFFKKIFPHEVDNRILKAFQYSGIAAGILPVVTTQTVYVDFLIVYQLILMLEVVYLIIIIALIFLNKRPDRTFVLIGTLFLCATVVNDIMAARLLVDTPPLVSYGLLVFIFMQTLILSNRFAKAYKTAEHLSAHLQTEVEKRTKDLEEAKNQIEEQSRQKTNLFINLAHETRTPITLLKNSIVEYMKKVGPDQELEILKHSIDKLSHDIINYLDAEKLERKQIFYNQDQIVNFSGLMEKKIELFRAITKKKGLTLSANIENNIYIKADPAAIDRVLNNLLDNAVKYTEKGSIVTEAIQKDEVIVLTVTDTGAGISDEHLKYIFSPYYQVSHEKRNIQGIGMGLYITKQIIDELNGEIKVAGKLREGSVFTVKLPAYSLQKDDRVIEHYELPSPRTVVTTIKPEKPEYCPEKNTILIVEDNPELVFYLNKNLKEKYNAFHAYNGKKALQEIHTIPKIDLILCDIMMDEMDGFRFYDEVQKIKLLQGTPFIFLTAKTTESDKIAGLKKGAVEYIYKPFNIEELLYRIESLLDIQRLKRILFIEEKYSALGKLYAGIAHQILNPVTGIKGNVELIKQILEKSGNPHDELTRAIRFVKEDVSRIIKTIDTLKKLSYNQPVEERTVNIGELVASLISLLPKEVKENTEFRVNGDKNLCIAEDQNALANILINLIDNAIDAINESPDKAKGLITITYLCADKNDYTLLVEDNGVGIKPENLPLIFDIDYTTKSPDKGTGLGLYVVRELAEKINWTIKVESEYGKGTLFILRKSK